MNKYFVSATAKYPVRIGDKYYEIGETIPVELTETEFNFLKDALNIESYKIMTEVHEGKVEKQLEQEEEEHQDDETEKKPTVDIKATTSQTHKTVIKKPTAIK